MRQIVLSAFLAVACTSCVAPIMRSTLATPATPAQLSELWEEPRDLAERNLFDGPWGKDLAPNPAATYTFVTAKTVGVSPGFGVTDERGMEWSVKKGRKRRWKWSCPASCRRSGTDSRRCTTCPDGP